ncbi:MAG: hypothetical protein R2751_13075 [Bacteroidales bacterium]
MFEHLYRYAGENGYSAADVTALLAGVLAGDDVETLRRTLIRHSEGNLRSYLEGVEPGALGLDSPEKLLMHLQQAGAGAGFTMDEVWDAMINGLYKTTMPSEAVPAGLLLIDLRRDADGALLEKLKIPGSFLRGTGLPAQAV